MARIEMGTVTRGTLATADLLASFARELSRVAYHDHVDLIAEAHSFLEADEEVPDVDRAAELVNDLQDALSNAAPAGMYFGNTEGDGADFGWWLNEAGRRAALADDFARSFERRQRDNGDKFLCLKEGAPEWMSDAIHSAHGDMLPDDWRYRIIAAIVEDVAERLRDDVDADLDEAQNDICESIVPIYNNERLQWLASRLDRAEYCDEAAREGLLSDSATMFDRIATGIYAEAEEVFAAILSALDDQTA